MLIFKLADPVPEHPATGSGPAPTSEAAGQKSPADPATEPVAPAEEHSNRLVLGLMPWGISGVIHTGLILLACLLVWSTMTRRSEEEIIVPTIRLGSTPSVPLQRHNADRVRTTPKHRRTVSRSPTPSPTLYRAVQTNMPLIGAKSTSGQKASPFSATVGAGSQFATKFFGTGGNAKRIILIIDASGSMIDTMPMVIRELKKTIQKMTEQQSFTVIFFQGGKIIEVPPPGLKSAGGQTKQRVIDWIDLSNHNIEPGGKTDPILALRLGLRYKPQLMFILSDNITGQGQYEIDQRRLLKEIDQANTGRTKINTIQFIYPDPLAKIGLKGTMELIAERSVGQYKFVDRRELNLE